MRSIDKLREYVTGGAGQGISIICEKNILKNLDNIEREVEDKLTSSEYNMRREHDEWVADRDANWVTLPLAADGEAIHAGDMLDGYGKTIEVVELRYGRSGWVLISRDSNAYTDTFAFTHHHAPTVEDVLREFAYGLGVPVADSYVAATAAKLRLTEGEDA